MAAGITDEDIEWARDKAKSLAELFERGKSVMHDDKRWTLTNAVEFLRLKAGARSEFYLRALDASKRLHMVHASDVVAAALLGWIGFVERGIAEVPVDAQ